MDFKEKKSPKAKGLVEVGSLSDPDFVQALLSVYRQIELGEQLEALLEPTVRWSGANCGVGLGAAEDRRSFVPLAGTIPPEDARYKAFGPLEPRRVREWLSGGVEVFVGLGPFEAVVGEWPGGAPRHTVVLPIRSEDRRWAGVLLLMVDEQPEARVLSRIEQFLEVTRPAVGHALQVLSMRELVIKDDTARCFNRRHFEEFLPEELSRASRFRAPISLIFLDMDNLKEVNQRHGHVMGSRTLYEVSVRVRAKIRKFDKLFRFGGDEFCIVLPETEWHGAMEVAERVRDAIAGKPLLLREVGAEGVPMTASLGVASFPLHARTQKALIERADRAMQRIKAAGKNAIGIAEIEGNEHGE